MEFDLTAAREHPVRSTICADFRPPASWSGSALSTQTMISTSHHAAPIWGSATEQRPRRERARTFMPDYSAIVLQNSKAFSDEADR